MNDLTTPLGVEPTAVPTKFLPSGGAAAPAWRVRLARVPAIPVLAGALLLLLAAVVAWVAIVDDPLGGEPHATATIERPKSGESSGENKSGEGNNEEGKNEEGKNEPSQEADGHHPAAGQEGALEAAHDAAPPAAEVTLPAPGELDAHGGQTLATVETSSGVVVVRGGTPAGPQGSAGSSAGSTAGVAPKGAIIPVPSGTPGKPSGPAAPKAALMERGREGALPRIGPDGSRPSEIYARPVQIPPALQGRNPARVAVLVGGLGISQNGTAEAVARLPGAVTLAYAPYGLDLERLVGQARSAGHEVMLQSPMEPFDYPDNDPGPQTLLSSGQNQGQNLDQNLDRLHWQMSRFTGYVGITNYLGARFTADAAALSPVLKEIAARGLIFADDGSSPRSLVGSLAGQAGLPTQTADLVIDANPTPEAIEMALQRLEQIANTKGQALGVATGLPLAVRHIAEWAGSLEKRGVLLVPVSALIKK